jgi:hypothetical protein
LDAGLLKQRLIFDANKIRLAFAGLLGYDAK